VSGRDRGATRAGCGSGPRTAWPHCIVAVATPSLNTAHPYRILWAIQTIHAHLHRVPLHLYLHHVPLHRTLHTVVHCANVPVRHGPGRPAPRPSSPVLPPRLCFPPAPRYRRRPPSRNATRARLGPARPGPRIRGCCAASPTRPPAPPPRPPRLSPARPSRSPGPAWVAASGPGPQCAGPPCPAPRARRSTTTTPSRPRPARVFTRRRQECRQAGPGPGRGALQGPEGQEGVEFQRRRRPQQVHPPRPPAPLLRVGPLQRRQHRGPPAPLREAQAGSRGEDRGGPGRRGGGGEGRGRQRGGGEGVGEGRRRGGGCGGGGGGG
jgi:uncharacterized membrane protein YgcG